MNDKFVMCEDGKKVTVYCSHTELVLTDIIKENPKNPNKHPVNQIDLLGKVIREQGWRAPITISKRSGMVVKGHGRLAAARLIHCDKCPVDYHEYETEADEIADLLADNKIAELAHIDEELIGYNVGFLTSDGFDISLAGFSDEKQIDEIIELDEVLDEVDMMSMAENPVWFGFRIKENKSSCIGEFKQLAEKHGIRFVCNV